METNSDCCILDELSGFEQAWKGAAQKHMPGLNDQFASYETLGEFIILEFQ